MFFAQGEHLPIFRENIAGQAVSLKIRIKKIKKTQATME